MIDDIEKRKLISLIAETCEQLKGLPPSETKEVVACESARNLLKVLGVTPQNINSEFRCANKLKVDLAARFSSLSKSPEFNVKPRDPELLIEVKRSGIDFKTNKKEYTAVVIQLERYLKAKSCKSVKYGIIFNGRQLQLFRKHGMLCYPISSVLSLDKTNIESTIKFLEKEVIEEVDSRGSIITVWNNKGGVGKTTTVQGLGLLLSMEQGYGKKERYKVLLIDYDHNQGDLTDNFRSKPSDGGTKDLLLTNIQGLKIKEEKINNYIYKFTEERGFPKRIYNIDLLPCDSQLSKPGFDYKREFSAKLDEFPLRQLCLELAKNYDFIIIDAPPNFEQSDFSKEAVNAADCILPIALYLEKNSCRNFSEAAIKYLKDSQNKRKDGGPFSLGLWFNRWKGTSAQDQVTKDYVEDIISKSNKDDQHELKRIFYKSLASSKSFRKIRECPDISRAIMEEKYSYLPGVVRFQRAIGTYKDLISEFTN